MLFAPESPPRLLAVVDWEMAGIGDPIVDLAWALIFHPGPEGTLRLGRNRSRRSPCRAARPPDQLVERYAERLGPRPEAIAWYDVFARWKLALVLEGSYAKFLRGLSDNPMHEFFGSQVDRLLGSAQAIAERGADMEGRSLMRAWQVSRPGNRSRCCNRSTVPSRNRGRARSGCGSLRRGSACPTS